MRRSSQTGRAPLRRNCGAIIWDNEPIEGGAHSLAPTPAVRGQRRSRLPEWISGFTLLTHATLAVADGNAAALQGGGIMRALLALTLVLGAVFAIAWFARRVAPAPLGGNWLKLQGAISVGTRERVMLVEVRDTWLVLGVAPGQVNVLHTLPRPEDVDGSTPPLSHNAFSAWLSKAINRRDKS